MSITLQHLFLSSSSSNSCCDSSDNNNNDDDNDNIIGNDTSSTSSNNDNNNKIDKKKNNLKERGFLYSYKNNPLFTIIVERGLWHSKKKKGLALKINVFLYFYMTY
jgi:hypothetical protein